jgi:hypothetical protein
MGANVIRGGALAPAWRENTLRSFQAAAASGATFVEFDVQVRHETCPAPAQIVQQQQSCS